MASLLLPNDPAPELKERIPPGFDNTLEIIQNLPATREADSLRNYDRYQVRLEIVEQLRARGVPIPDRGWYVHDTIPGTRIYMIRHEAEVEMYEVGKIPYLIEERNLPPWDSVIIDLEDPSLFIPTLQYKEGLVSDSAIGYSDRSIVFNGYDTIAGNAPVRIDFMGDVRLFPFMEAPYLRIWRYKGVIYCSTKNRINAWNFIVSGNKTYGDFWGQLSGGVDLKDLFSTVEGDNHCFYIQLNTPELLPYTRINSASLALLSIIKIRPTDEDATIYIPRLSNFNLGEVNTWMGYEKTGDPRLTDGNAIVLINEMGEMILIKSIAYAWRAALIGPINPSFSWPKRFLEVCNSRFVPEDQYLRIFPNVIDKPLSKPSARLENTIAIWSLITPSYQREDIEKLYDGYWGPEGMIARLAKHLADPNNLNYSKAARRNQFLNLVKKYRQETKIPPNMNQETLYRKVLFNSDPTKPYINGSDIYSLLKHMLSQEKFREKKALQATV